MRSLLKPEVRAWLGRGLFVFLLGVVLLVEAGVVVALKQRVRDVSSEYASLLEAQRQAQGRWSRLVLEYGHLSSPVTLERRARRALGMAFRAPVQTITLYQRADDEDR